jgi:YHS domain-containing protein
MKLPVAALAKDPVCGMTVDPSHAAATVEHAGQTYFFCSQGCAHKFRSDPGSYLTAGPKGMEAAADATKASYTPLVVVLGLIFLVAATISFRDWRAGHFDSAAGLGHFMAGFFLVFAGFKLIDLPGFADGYSTYDLLARRVRGYGFVYPFIELGFGLAMIVAPQDPRLLVAEIAVMAFSGLGVAIKLAKGERFQCACLGTFLKVPLTKVTLVEDFGMAALAAAMLALR